MQCGKLVLRMMLGTMSLGGKLRRFRLDPGPVGQWPKKSLYPDLSMSPFVPTSKAGTLPLYFPSKVPGRDGPEPDLRRGTRSRILGIHLVMEMRSARYGQLQLVEGIWC